MRIIKEYRVFEQEMERPLSLLDKILYFLPRVQKDPFTQQIKPYLDLLIEGKETQRSEEFYSKIKGVAKRRFAGFDTLITKQEILERFISHYIDQKEGILRKKDVKKLLRDIKIPVKRSTKTDENYQISPLKLDNFTDKMMEILQREGIKEQDIEIEFRRIYEWFCFVLKHFYHNDTIKSLKYMQPGMLFTEEEIAKMMEN